MINETIKEFIKKGYAQKLSDKKDKSLSPKTNCIPHSGVTNITKPKKLRMVFDAASKFSDISLNHHLLKSPDLLNSVIGILMSLREGQYVITGHIEAMYLKIKVLKEDIGFMRFLWRENFDFSNDGYIMYVRISLIKLTCPVVPTAS